MALLNNKYPWYELVCNSGELTQGDILMGCPVPSLDDSVYKSIRNEEEVSDPIDVKLTDLVILSQACDLLNDKISTVVLCTVIPLSVLGESNQHYSSRKGIEELRTGKTPAYHLLDKYTEEQFNSYFTIVNFHELYTLPKDFLSAHAETIEKRLRILPPYREHLSQAFARYFMRVGLPIDIDKDELAQMATN
ncbi:MAG: hypothetical protein KAQ69_05970 [Spirochaetales bacterium]|nr:hypothetical protein [Spirochaetales bacterium]